MVCKWIPSPTSRKTLAIAVALGIFTHTPVSLSQTVDIEAADETATVEVAVKHSPVRRAINPANRKWSVKPTGKQTLQFSAEVYDDQDDSSAVQAASGFQVDPHPLPVPDAHADAFGIPEVPTYESVPLAQGPELTTTNLGYGEDFNQGIFDAVYDGGISGSNCDDLVYGNSICNQFGCGPRPCLSIINPLVDAPGFVNSLLCRMQFRVASATFWKTESTVPVLATSDTDASLGPNDVALLGGNSTVDLFGGGGLLNDAKQGVRADITLWLDPVQQRGAWVRLYNSGSHTINFNGDSSTNAILARPFNDITSGTLTPATNLLSFPGERSGELDISLQSKVQGGDLLFRHRLAEDELVRSDFLWGYQKVRFAESLTFDSSSLALPTSTTLTPGTSLELQDRFSTANQFNGGQIGYLRSAHDGCWYFDGMAKIGFGTMNRTTNISGFSRATVPGVGTNETDQGLLARRTNAGVYEESTFVLVPELAFNAGYLLTQNLHFTVGYTYLRLPKVTRVGDALDSDLAANLSNPLVGSLNPAFNFSETHVDAHSLDLGLQYRY